MNKLDDQWGGGGGEELKPISLSHAMRPGLIRHFWVANRAGPENDNKFKERLLKINIGNYLAIFLVVKNM